MIDIKVLIITTGLVEFVQNSEAKTAFRQLAYSKFKHLPLYLEWAPDKVFTHAAHNTNGKKVLKLTFNWIM